MQVTIEANEVAHEMEEDGEFAMDILAHLAEAPEKFFREVSINGIGCEWHKPVPEFLRRLAAHLERER